LAQALQQVLQALHPPPVGRFHAVLEHAPQGAAKVPLVQHVLGDEVHRVLGGEGVDLLGAVPAAVTIQAHDAALSQ